VYSVGEFVASVVEHRAPMITGRDGRRAIEIVQACYESARDQRFVTLT
jgi:predicted dehydrogenase